MIRVYKQLYKEVTKSFSICYLKTIGPRVFVLGNQKSGTSAIASLLGIMTGHKTAVDFSTKQIMAIKQVRRNKLSLPSLLCNNVDRVGSASILKEPHLTFLYQQIKSSYPRTKFVFVVRDPAENIRSICDRLRLTEKDLLCLVAKFDFCNTYQFNPGWELVFQDETLYPNHLENISLLELLAHRWKMVAQVYLSNSEHLHLIRYEDFLKNKEFEISQLSDALRMPKRHSIQAFMNQQFQPRGSRKADISIESRKVISKIAHSEMEALDYIWQ